MAMAELPLELIDEFADRRVLVIGEAMLDTYLTGRATRLSREAPVPIVSVDRRDDVPGGAANAAVNLAALGAQTMLLSVVGDDQPGETLRHGLEELGVSGEHLIVEPRRVTLTKRRVSADGQLLVRFDEGTTSAIEPSTERRLIARLEQLYRAADAVLISDYAYGVLTPRIVGSLNGLLQLQPRPLIVDAKDPTAYRALRPTACKPNYSEAVRLLGAPESDQPQVRLGQVAGSADRLLELTGAQVVAVTMDRDGALVFERGEQPYRTYARPHEQSRAAGAGDTFVAALTLALASRAETPTAAEVAAAAATVVVDKDGTATCSASELRDHFISQHKLLPDLRSLIRRVGALEEQSKRVVFTNGCFDILHRGHIGYLNRAKALGDVLIVGLNTDSGVRRLKGPDRPVNSLEDRAQVLAALSAIDHIIAFDEETPAELIRLIRPQVYVKGGDYSRESLPEAALVESLGGEVRILPYLEDHSTTQIIERMRRADGGDPSRPAQPAARRRARQPAGEASRR